MSQNNALAHGKLSGDTHITAEIMRTYEVPFINKSVATKRLRDRKENGKCTNATNRRSPVGLSVPF